MKIMMAMKSNSRFVKQNKTRVGSGLYNGVNLITRALVQRGLDIGVVEISKATQLSDEIERHKPNLVIVQALWLDPDEIEQLKKKFRKVKFACHLHSNIPFLSIEGKAMEYCHRYAKMGVKIIANSYESFIAYRSFLPEEMVVWCNNIYSRPETKAPKKSDEHLDVGCFGAIRPMKNILTAAMAAIQYAKDYDRKVNFHFNSSRIEAGGSGTYQNLIQLFLHLEDERVAMQPVDWVAPDQFPEYMSRMHVHLQPSMTETFNVVTADAIMANVPIVVSRAIDWVDESCIVDSNLVTDYVKKMNFVMGEKTLLKNNKLLLEKYKATAISQWVDYCSAYS